MAEIKKKVNKKPTPKKVKEVKEEIILPETEQTEKKEGLGDVVKAITGFFGFEQCEPCKERQAKLNKMFPFTKKANPISEEDAEFVMSIKNKIEQSFRARFEQLVRDTFNERFVACNCPTKYRDALDRLKIQVEYQKKIQPSVSDI